MDQLLIAQEYTLRQINKSFTQITNIPNSFILADDISVGSDRKIPLWMIGLLS